MKKINPKLEKLIADGETDHIKIAEQTDAYCPLAWTHLHVSAIGDVLPCCIGEWKLPFGNINNQSFDEIWNGEDFKAFRLKMLNDEKVPHCKGCYKKEETSNWSLRVDAIRKWHKHAIPLIDTTEEDGASNDSKPIYWDIRFSNICNMRCRMCGHFSSSRWYNDAKILATDYDEHRYKTKKEQAIVHGVEDSVKLLDRLDEYLPYVEEFYFAGGEPLIMEEHYRIVKRLDELGLHNAYLRYSTNFLQMRYKDLDAIEMWKKFDKVYCAASIDTFGARAENIRKDTDWKIIEENVKRLKEEAPHVNFGIAPTVQIMNILTVTDLHKDWIEKGYLMPNDMFFNILHNPSFYDLQNLTPNLKKQATQKLQDHLKWIKAEFPDYNSQPLIDTVTNTINYMNGKEFNPYDLYDLVNQTKMLDEIRNENTFEIFPELSEIWENYS